MLCFIFFFFFFNDTATTEIYTLSLHDALPICAGDLIDRSTFFRNDLVRLAFPGNPPTGAPANPHTFLTNINPLAVPPGVVQLALAAQEQIGTFFESDGTVIIDPDGAGPFFE